VVGAGLVAALLLFFNSLLADLPQSALAAVLIGAALSLLNLRALVRYWQVRKSACVLSVIASLGVIVLGVLQGIVIAIALAVALYFRRGWQPHGAVLGRVQATGEWHNIAEFPEARVEPGVVVYRWEAPLFFANCTSFRTQLREAVTDIDVSAAQMLEQLDRELNARDIHLAFVELRSRLQELLRRYELFDQIDQDHFYPSLEAGLAAIEQENRTRPPSGESAAEQ
jgi:MFS superfamily sulfate permease-like transporter